MDKYNDELVPMPEAELLEMLKDWGGKREDIISAYKKGNTKILIDGSLIPKDEVEYQKNIHKLELALEAIYPGTKITITKTE